MRGKSSHWGTTEGHCCSPESNSEGHDVARAPTEKDSSCLRAFPIEKPALRGLLRARELPTLSGRGHHGQAWPLRLSRLPRRFPTRQAAAVTDRGPGPQASSELPASSRALRASFPALRAWAPRAYRVTRALALHLVDPADARHSARSRRERRPRTPRERNRGDGCGRTSMVAVSRARLR